MSEENDFMGSALEALQGLRGTSKEVIDLALKTETSSNQQQEAEANQGNQNVENKDSQLQNENNNSNQEATGNVSESELENNTNSNEGSDTIEIESAIFGGKKIIKPTDENQQENNDIPALENVEQVNSYLKDNFGVDDIKSLGQVIESARNNEILLSETKTKLENAEKLFQVMNPDLYQAVVADLNGQDWRSIVNQNSLDFKKSVDDYKEKDLVENFFPGEISNEDWEEFNDEDGDPRVKKTINLLIKQSKEKFNTTKSQKEKEASDLIKKHTDMRRLVETSLNESVSLVETQFQGIDKGYLNNVVKKIQTEGVNSLFYNEDGTFKKEAVLRFVMAEEGFDLVQKQQKALEKRIETAKNQEILTRGANTPSVQSGKNVNQTTQISEEAQKQLDFLKGLRKESTY